MRLSGLARPEGGVKTARTAEYRPVVMPMPIANASARTLAHNSVQDRVLPLVGLAGCLVIAVFLPPAALLTAAAVLAFGAIVYALRHPHGSSPRPSR